MRMYKYYIMPLVSQNYFVESVLDLSDVAQIHM